MHTFLWISFVFHRLSVTIHMIENKNALPSNSTEQCPTHINVECKLCIFKIVIALGARAAVDLQTGNWI